MIDAIAPPASGDPARDRASSAADGAAADYFSSGGARKADG